MIDIFGLGGFVINVSKYFREIEEKKQAQLMDSLANNVDINMVEYREQLEYLQATLNRELPVAETTTYKTFNTFVKEAGVTNNFDELIAKIKFIVDDSKELSDVINELKEWDTTPEVIKNIKSIISIISKLVGVVLFTFINGKVEDTYKYSDEEIAEAMSKYLDDVFKLNIVLEMFDKPVFKSISYVAIVIIREIISNIQNDIIEAEQPLIDNVPPKNVPDVVTVITETPPIEDLNV